VESVLAQTFRELEVTVVIDGPDEATASSLAEIEERDARLHVMALECNVGGCGARNRGIEASRGVWIALLDDDDEWLPEKLEKQLAAVEGVDPERTQPIVATQLYALTGDGRRMVWPRSAPTEPLSEYLFCRKTWAYGDAVLQTSTLMAPRSLFMRVPFTENLKNFQEDDWILRTVCETGASVVLIPKPLVEWRVWYDEGTASNRADWRMALRWIQGLDHVVTRRAYAGFIATDVAREAKEQKAWGQAVPLLFEMLWRGRPRLFDLAIFAAAWVPNGFRKRVASLLGS
jgi:glycosyltransferase involved in cell wall biosynthesis